MGMRGRCAEESGSVVRDPDPEAYSVVKHRLDAMAERNRTNLIGEIESQLSKNLRAKTA